MGYRLCAVNELDSFSRFDRTAACEGYTVTAGHIPHYARVRCASRDKKLNIEWFVVRVQTS